MNVRYQHLSCDDDESRGCQHLHKDPFYRHPKHGTALHRDIPANADFRGRGQEKQKYVDGLKKITLLASVISCNFP